MEGFVFENESFARDAAEDVYKEWYKRGLQDGWTEGWFAALRSGAEAERNERCIVNPHRNCDPAERPGNLEMRDADTSTTLELSPEWALFFAQRAVLRAAACNQDAELHDGGTHDEIDLGGGVAALRREQAEVLYGERAEEILRSDAAMEAQFIAATSEIPSPLWPVVALSDMGNLAINHEAP